MVAMSGAQERSSLMADAATADAATAGPVRAVKRAIVEGHRSKDRAALERLYADGDTAYLP
jgi:hypothetical protein